MEYNTAMKMHELELYALTLTNLRSLISSEKASDRDYQEYYSIFTTLKNRHNKATAF